MKPSLLDLKQIAARYGITTDTIRSLCKSGAIPFVNGGGKLKMFNPEACDAALTGMHERITGANE